jgi:hypothetical protein
MLQYTLSTAQLVWCAGSVLLAYALFARLVLPLISTQAKFLDAQTWVGVKKQWFARSRASFNTLKSTREMLLDGTEVGVMDATGDGIDRSI